MKSQGYALILVMVFLFIFSILVKSAVETSILTAYSSRSFSDATSLFYIAENTLRDIEKKLQRTQKEEQGTLHFQESKITYAVHSLALDPCAIFAPEKIAHYYQIEITAETNHDHVRLYSTEIVPLQTKEVSDTCSNTLRFVHPGRQSWHLSTI